MKVIAANSFLLGSSVTDPEWVRELQSNPPRSPNYMSYVPTTGHTASGVDPIGVGISIAHCLHSVISWTNGCILTDLTETYYWERGKKWLDFGDLGLFFKVTPALWNFQILTKQNLSAPYLLNQMTDSGQTSYIVMLGWFKDLITFWWPWPNFQGRHTIKTKIVKFWPPKAAPYLLNQMTDSGQTSYIITGWFKDLNRFWWPWPNFQGHHTIKMSLVCTLYPEPIGGFWPKLHRNTIGTWERNN